MTTDWIDQYDRALSRAAEQMHLWDGRPIDECTVVFPIDSWSAFQSAISKHGPNFWFRGQSDVTWRLRPSLERVTAFPVPRRELETASIGMVDLPQDAFYAEYELTREFKRRAHHYLQQLPADADHLEWLALMQHHGVPTRLLDWTHSPYVGAYFAVADTNNDLTCSLWALDAHELDRVASGLLGLPAVPESPEGKREYFVRLGPDFQTYFVDDPRVAVLPLQPFRMNERLTMQQAAFLCPANLVLSFEDNLAAVVHVSNGQLRLFRYDIPGALRHEFLDELNRMNLNHATLFPGLDGFAASLRRRFASRYEASLERADWRRSART